MRRAALLSNIHKRLGLTAALISVVSAAPPGLQEGGRELRRGFPAFVQVMLGRTEVGKVMCGAGLQGRTDLPMAPRGAGPTCLHLSTALPPPGVCRAAKALET